MNRTKHSKIGFALGAALLGVLTGCVGYVEGPRHARTYEPPRPGAVWVRDSYVYYPSYQVYYSGGTRQYVYLEGSAWVSRPAPPRVAVDVLFASPSVSVDFHDHPSAHHATVVRTYPRTWAPPGWKHGNKEGPKPGKGNRK